MSEHHITSTEALVELIGEPHDFVKQKVQDRLDEDMQAFIARSPLLFLSTIDSQGNPDISPKGDPAGFVQVANDQLLHIPDRPGNKLVYGFLNILANPAVGLIFVVPNERETLRIKGKATLSKEPALLESMAVNRRPAVLATSVAVEECFFHCGKAMIRSKTWDPASWGESGKSPIVRQVVRQMAGDEELERIIEGEIEKNYREELY